MDEKDKIRIARIAVNKGWDFETLKYGDDLYGREHEADSVWEYVDECIKHGTDAFDRKYDL